MKFILRLQFDICKGYARACNSPVTVNDTAIPPGPPPSVPHPLHTQVFAFSSENWQRDSDEVSFLLQLVIRALQQELQQLHSRNICFRAIGQLERLPLALQRQVQE